MAAVERFEDLIAWEKARELYAEVRRVCLMKDMQREFELKDQLLRSALSVMSNIAEGFERGGRAEFAQFLSLAKGSCAEVRSLLYAALDATVIDQDTFAKLSRQAEEVSRIVGGLRSAVARQRDEARKSR
ncbi:MAG: four helix bundle protein [Thermoflexaceae bacterium]|nr:four helix bundle protein [Thermoflexaceae bacterium]